MPGAAAAPGLVVEPPQPLPAFEAFLAPEIASQLHCLRLLRPTFLLGFTGFWAALSGAHEQALMLAVDEACVRPSLARALLREKEEEEEEKEKEKEEGCDGSARSRGGDAVAGVSPSPSLLAVVASSAEWAACRAAFVKTRRGGALRRRLLLLCRRSLGGCLLKAATGGAVTPASVLAFMSSLLAEGNSTNVVDAYGATEFPGIASNGVIADDVEVRLDPVPAGLGTPALLFAGDDGTSNRPRGEVVVRRTGKAAAASATCYWKRPALTRAKWLPGGWFRTGDVGELNYAAEVVPNTFAKVLHTADGRFARRPLLRIVDRVGALEVTSEETSLGMLQYVALKRFSFLLHLRVAHYALLA